MFNENDLKKIEEYLESGLTPEQVAAKIGMTRGRFNHRLLKSGYEIKTSRSLSHLPAVARVIAPSPTRTITT